MLRAHFGLPSVESEEGEGRPPIKVQFEIPYFTTSGIQVCIVHDIIVVLYQKTFILKVRYLKIIEKSGYTALPWVRYITQNGGRPQCFPFNHAHQPRPLFSHTQITNCEPPEPIPPPLVSFVLTMLALYLYIL